MNPALWCEGSKTMNGPDRSRSSFSDPAFPSGAETLNKVLFAAFARPPSSGCILKEKGEGGGFKVVVTSKDPFPPPPPPPPHQGERFYRGRRGTLHSNCAVEIARFLDPKRGVFFGRFLPGPMGSWARRQQLLSPKASFLQHDGL